MAGFKTGIPIRIRTKTIRRDRGRRSVASEVMSQGNDDLGYMDIDSQGSKFYILCG